MKNLLVKIYNRVFKKENIIFFILSFAALVFVIIGIIRVYTPYESFDGEIKREEYGDRSRDVTVIAETEFEGVAASEKITLNIDSKSLSEAERQKRLEKCKEELPRIILSDNESLDMIISDLNLINIHNETGVEITWSSGRPELIDEFGTVYPGECDDNGYVLLTAQLYLDGESEEWKCNVRHRLNLSGANVSKALKNSIENIRQKIDSENDKDVVVLPSDLDNGLKLKWSRPIENNYFLYAAILIILMVLLYSKRRSDIKNMIAKRKQEIEKEFPYFLDKLMMLLSAGVILSDAVQRISDDYIKYTSKKNRSIFYEELTVSVNSMKESNSSFSEELMLLSQRLDIREFARLSVILRDSLESGMDMVSKLEEESTLIWGARKAAVEKLGKTADTKLIFPLVIILVVLIVIVMTPAVMQM